MNLIKSLNERQIGCLVCMEQKNHLKYKNIEPYLHISLMTPGNQLMNTGIRNIYYIDENKLLIILYMDGLAIIKSIKQKSIYLLNFMELEEIVYHIHLDKENNKIIISAINNLNENRLYCRMINYKNLKENQNFQTNMIFNEIFIRFPGFFEFNNEHKLALVFSPNEKEITLWNSQTYKQEKKYKLEEYCYSSISNNCLVAIKNPYKTDATKLWALREVKRRINSKTVNLNDINDNWGGELEFHINLIENSMIIEEPFIKYILPISLRDIDRNFVDYKFEVIEAYKNYLILRFNDSNCRIINLFTYKSYTIPHTNMTYKYNYKILPFREAYLCIDNYGIPNIYNFNSPDVIMRIDDVPILYNLMVPTMVHFDKNGEIMITISKLKKESPKIVILDLRTGKILKTIITKSRVLNRFSDMHFDEDNNSLIIGSKDGEILILKDYSS